jgi:4-methyl-5(b-hydroxyethyl)-thiazole monophosphate biosynthesis
MRTFVFLADGFEEIEAIVPIDILRRADIEVTTVSVSDNYEVCGAHGISVLADSLFAETDFSNSDLLLLPGGMPGTKHLDEHEGLKKLIQRQADQSKNIAAICAAPSILGKMGLLQGKEAICYPGFENQLHGALVSTSSVVQSGFITTAKGPGAAVDFALHLVGVLKGNDVMNQISAAICR